MLTSAKAVKLTPEFCKMLYNKATNSFCRGRLTNASFLFVEAAQNYTALAMSLKETEDVELCKFNAAVCFYLGNSFIDCLKILDSVKKARLSSEIQELYDDLYEESMKKRRPAHWETVKLDFEELKKLKRHKDIIALIRNNPYFLTDELFLKQMITSCKELEMNEIAQLFESDLKELRSYD